MTTDAIGATKALQRRKLGRGLGALLNETRREEPLIVAAPGDAAPVSGTVSTEAAATTAPSQGLASLAVAAIEPHPDQPRRRFEEGALEELAASIATRGVVQPVIVRPLGAGRYQLVAGERRW